MLHNLNKATVLHYQGGHRFLAMVSHVAGEHKHGLAVTQQCVDTYWPALHHQFNGFFSSIQ